MCCHCRCCTCSFARHLQDRHLFGMKNLAIAKQRKLPGYIIPGLLTDPLYSRLMSAFVAVMSENVCLCDVDLLRSVRVVYVQLRLEGR